MIPPHVNLHVCHACPFACPPPRAGRCACACNGRDIVQNAMRGECPAGRFALAIAAPADPAASSAARPQRGLGDTVKAVADATGLSRLARAWERLSGRPCGCARRQAALNRRVPYPRDPHAPENG